MSFWNTFASLLYPLGLLPVSTYLLSTDTHPCSGTVLVKRVNTTSKLASVLIGLLGTCTHSSRKHRETPHEHKIIEETWR